MKIYFAFLFTLLVGAGFGAVWGYRQGLKDGANTVTPFVIPSPPCPLYIYSPEDSSEPCPDPFSYLILQDFGPV